MHRKLQRSVIEIRRSSATRPYESRSVAVPTWPIIDAVGYEFITVDVEPPIATVTLNRPKVLNALSPELIAEVSQALRELDADGGQVRGHGGGVDRHADHRDAREGAWHRQQGRAGRDDDRDRQTNRAPAGREGSTGSAHGQGGRAQSLRVTTRRRTRGGAQELLLPVLNRRSEGGHARLPRETKGSIQMKVPEARWPPKSKLTSTSTSTMEWD